MASKKLKKILDKLIDEYGYQEVRKILNSLIWPKYKKSMKKPIYKKSKVEEIINKYTTIRKNKKKILMICHGKQHSKKVKGSLTLNRANFVKPNIVSNAWSDKAMGYLPDEYFDKITMEHCPLGNPFGKENKQLWKNLYRILKKGGEIENSSILGLYGVNKKKKWYEDMTKRDQSKLRGEVRDIVKKMGFRSVKHIHTNNDEDITFITK